MKRLLSLVFLVLIPLNVSAEVLVLLQGYLGEDDPWRRSGVGAALVAAGWQDGGHLHASPSGIVSTLPPGAAPRKFYTVAIPTEAPLLVQLRHLEPMMSYVRTRHSQETLVLIGHSAGGVLGRLYLVHHPDAGVSALITIASPHMGTDIAEVGRVVGQSPLGWLAPLVGAESLNRSQGLYHDLMREQSGNLLFWLNRQPHPAVRYISVVRSDNGSFPFDNDMAVPAWSQNMNRVPALQGRSELLLTVGGHSLNPGDGPLLVDLLSGLQRL
jgi:triacylglycerol lipase